MNTPKTSRGVQESDVWAAADALLAQGVRPTIERVRLHIGRGSPNTVSPMLESWFGTLGERLGLAEQKRSVYEDIPAPVLEMAASLWKRSLKTASQQLESELQERSNLIAQAQAELDAQIEQFAQQESAFAQQKQTLDAALQLAHKQNQEQSQRLDENHQLLKERDALLDALRQEMAAQHQQQEEMQKLHAAALQNASEERQRLAEQFAGNERRMLAELDRARQEQTQTKKLLQESERRHEQRYEALHQRFVESEEAVVQARSELLKVQHALQVAEERAAHWNALLLASQNTQANEAVDSKFVRSRPLRSAARSALNTRVTRKLK